MAEIEEEVDKGMYSTVSEVGSWIAKRYEVEYSQSGVRAIMKKLDFVHKKALIMPGKVDVAAQESFLQILEPFLLESASVSNEAIYFVDGVHPQHNTRADYVWTKREKEKHLPSNTGRQRMNINGAINFCDPTDVQIVESDTINGESTR